MGTPFICRSAIIVLLTFHSSVNYAQLIQVTDLPTIYITTTQPVDSKDDYRIGTMTVVASDGTHGLYDGPIEIKGRGNSTWYYEKKPYKVKLGSKYNLLGMPANETKWVLLANAMDNTLIRNALAFEISQFMGFAYTAAYRFADVYLNGTYLGNYLVVDQLERGNNRLQLDKLASSDDAVPKLTGGYLVQAEIYADQEANHFRTSLNAMACAVKYPEDDLSETQFNYIKDYINTYESRLFSEQALDPTSGYRSFNDRASQVNWLIACELTGNPDSFLSVYMYKQRNDPKIYFGPLWDFDAGFNNFSHLGDATYKRMSVEAYGGGFPNEMLKDPELRAALKKRWNELKSAGLAAHLDDKIVALAQTVAQSQAQNKLIWPYNNPNNIPNYNSTPYATLIAELRVYMSKRIEYLDQQFNDVIRSDMYYKLANRSTGMVIDVTDNFVSQKTTDNASYTQQWRFTSTDIDGVTYYRIQNRSTEKYLTAPNGGINTQLILDLANLSNTQLWRPQGTAHNALYGFINKESSYALENQDGLPNELNPISQNSIQIDAASSQQFTFIPFELISGAALPVTIFGLRAQADASGVRLSWQVAENINGDKFLIERATEVSKLRPDSLAQVKMSESGGGTYEFYDQDPVPGANYYRLKMVDKNGSTEYSRYVKADFALLNDIRMFPQPTTDIVNISFTAHSTTDKGIVEIFNQQGTKIQSINMPVLKGHNDFHINAKNFIPGLYQLQFRVNEQVVTKKLLILH